MAQRHPIPAPAGVPGPPLAHVAGRASAAPPRGAAPAATNAATAAVRSSAQARRACAGRRGECGRLSRSPAPSLHPPGLDTPLDPRERDAVSGWLLPCLNPPSRSGTPTSKSPTPGPGACGGLGVLSGPGRSSTLGRPARRTGRQSHRQRRLAAARAGDTDFGSLVALGRKFLEALPGRQTPPVLLRTQPLSLSVFLSPGGEPASQSRRALLVVARRGAGHFPAGSRGLRARGGERALVLGLLHLLNCATRGF